MPDPAAAPPEARLPRWLHPAPITLLALTSLGAFTWLCVTYPRGAETTPLLEAIGDLHPLFVHFPAALLPTAVMLEIFGRWQHRFATRMLLALSAIMSAAALGPGWILALDRNSTTSLTLHLWTGVAVAVGSLTAVWLHHATRRPRPYRVALFASFLAVAAAGHFGAGLTHGEMFAKWLSLLSPPAPPATPTLTPTLTPPPTVFAEKVLPALERTCVSCHGEKKQKGGLRVDSLAALTAPSDSGEPAVVAGQPDKSPLLTRILLPADDDDHMPPSDKPQPTPEEIDAIRQWIAQQAAAELPPAP